MNIRDEKNRCIIEQNIIYILITIEISNYIIYNLWYIITIIYTRLVYILIKTTKLHLKLILPTKPIKHLWSSSKFGEKQNEISLNISMKKKSMTRMSNNNLCMSKKDKILLKERMCWNQIR